MGRDRLFNRRYDFAVVVIKINYSNIYFFKKLDCVFIPGKIFINYCIMPVPVKGPVFYLIQAMKIFFKANMGTVLKMTGYPYMAFFSFQAANNIL